MGLACFHSGTAVLAGHVCAQRENNGVNAGFACRDGSGCWPCVLSCEIVRQPASSVYLRGCSASDGLTPAGFAVLGAFGACCTLPWPSGVLTSSCRLDKQAEPAPRGGSGCWLPEPRSGVCNGIPRWIPGFGVRTDMPRPRHASF